MPSPMPPDWVLDALRQGIAIPAHPLALAEDGRFDPRCQRALTRYYAAAGAGGVAVGVHTTQFEIRAPGVDLLGPVLRTTADALDELERAGRKPLVRIAGVCGLTAQALAEAALARDLGYHAALLSLAALPDAADDELVRHCRSVAEVMPLMGFYLQPAVGGRPLGADFWRRLAEIENVVAIKIAPFNRYQTLDVACGVAQAGRAGDVALYTGNDDNIVADLLTPLDLHVGGRSVRQRMVGALLGHWAVWAKAAIDLFRQLRDVARIGWAIPPPMLGLGPQVTQCNAALFDADHGFAGCIAGIQYVLHRQGLLASPRCLGERQRLSPGQADRIEAVRLAYPHLVDDDFVAAGRDEWLA